MKSLNIILLSGLISFSTYAKSQHPNVVIFFVDDMGWTDLGYMGSDYYLTPNIDALAKDGITFTDSYSACTVCSPGRASVMTGKYPARLHVTNWIPGHNFAWAKMKVPDWKMYLDTKEYTMAEAFRDAGYTTIHLGKWHLGESEDFSPENHGFDHNIKKWKDVHGYFAPEGTPISPDGEREYLTELFAEKACDFIDKHEKDKPFFMNFWFYNVHLPLMAKKDKIAKYEVLIDENSQHKNPVYAAMIEHTDDAIGRVINKLKAEGLYDNTIILFTSDNGGIIGKGIRKVTSNAPLRAGKGSMYEGGVRVPTILRLPHSEQKGKTISEPVISIDYYPTLMELADVELSAKQIAEFDGKSWKPLLEGDATLDREALFWHYPHYHPGGAVPYSAIRKGDWRLLQNFETNEFELYNLKQDISESQNLIDAEPEIAKKLKKDLQEWRSSVNAQYATINPKHIKEKERKKLD